MFLFHHLKCLFFSKEKCRIGLFSAVLKTSLFKSFIILHILQNIYTHFETSLSFLHFANNMRHLTISQRYAAPFITSAQTFSLQLRMYFCIPPCCSNCKYIH